MKKISLIFLSLAFIGLVAMPTFAQASNPGNNLKANQEFKGEKKETKKAKPIINSAKTEAIKKANLAYAEAIKAANTIYKESLKTAKNILTESLKNAKTKTERQAANKIYKEAVKAAQKVRNDAHRAALNILKEAKKQANALATTTPSIKQ